MPQVCQFLTQLGWFAIIGRKGRLTGVRIGYPCQDTLAQAISAGLSGDSPAPPGPPTCVSEDWHPELRRRLQRFAEGTPESFDDVLLEWPPLTDFQRRVLEATRQIPFGQTLSYGQLAARAGSPRAARAVGTVMANNRFPIIVPCHRVVASGEKLGGFSAPQGTVLKRALLDLEAAAKPVRVLQNVG